MPFKVRRVDSLVSHLENHANILDGFVPVALHSFLENTDQNDLDEKACPYAGKGSRYLVQNQAKAFRDH